MTQQNNGSVIHPLGGHGFLVEINADYIQAIYKERDEALARNRDLEAWVEGAQTLINTLSGSLIDCDALRVLAHDWHQLVQDYEDMDLQDPLDQYALWDEQWKALKKRTEQLTGMQL